ncbi:MAG: class I SAM-dependent methyltransferase [Bacteroidia bacterium]
MKKSNNGCRICNNSQDNQTYTAKEMMYGLRKEFDYFQCSNCNCLQIADFPADMSLYYPDNYYSFEKYDGKKFKGFIGRFKRIQYASMLKEKSPLKGLMASLSGSNDYNIFNGLGIHSKSKILDVGCGNGKSFLNPLAEIGFNNVKGCDPFINESIEYDNGLSIAKSNIFEIEGKWDVITYHHSFEHIPNPLEHMKKVSELLNPAGVCIIRIPTVSSYAWEHYGVNWVQLDAPRHFFLHSAQSMKVLANHAALELYKSIYDSTHFQFTGSEKYLKGIPLSAPRPRGLKNMLLRKIKKQGFKKKAKLLNHENRGDQAAFFFRKTID